MKIVLVAIHPCPSPQSVPLANAYLQACALADPGLSATVDISRADFFIGTPAAECAAALLRENPDAVGFSLYVWNRALTLATVAILRSLKPALTIFAGGPEATADPSGVCAGAPLDFLIAGDGEVPFVEAMTRLHGKCPLADTPGLIIPGSTGLRYQAPRPAKELDSLPSPYLSGVLVPEEHGGVLWQLSRGCDFACDFCFDHKGNGGVRRFSLERLKAELAFFISHRVSQVFVLDSTFNRDMKRAKEILRLIKRVAPHIHFHFEVRSEFIDREMAKLFAQLTCSLQIGLQSADPAILKQVGRVFSPADFLDRISMLNESGAIFGFDLIYGLPGDSLDGFRASLDFALRLYPNHLDIFPLALLPGTRLAGRAAESGLRHLTEPPYTLLSTPSFSAAEMEQARKTAVACDIFYSRGKAVAWFNPVLNAVGLSAASLLEGFAAWLAEKYTTPLAEEQFTDAEIWVFQRDFLKMLFARQKKGKLLPVALDLVDFHFNYAAALLAPAPELPSDRELEQTDLLQTPLSRAPSARLVRFNYEILDILETGDIDLKEFAACFTATGSSAVMYPRAGEVFTESLIEPYFQLLTALDGITPAGEVAARLAIPADEAASFLEFAAAEGIVCLAAR
jgi:radical SAM superfamily enzyme YgiQ (UPF0313 family)